MKLIDILSLTTDYTNVNVLNLNDEIIASYDGKDSIPTELNNIEVHHVSVENNTFQITICIEAE